MGFSTEKTSNGWKQITRVNPKFGKNRGVGVSSGLVADTSSKKTTTTTKSSSIDLPISKDPRVIAIDKQIAVKQKEWNDYLSLPRTNHNKWMAIYAKRDTIKLQEQRYALTKGLQNYRKDQADIAKYGTTLRGKTQGQINKIMMLKNEPDTSKWTGKQLEITEGSYNPGSSTYNTQKELRAKVKEQYKVNTHNETVRALNEGTSTPIQRRNAIKTGLIHSGSFSHTKGKRLLSDAEKQEFIRTGKIDIPLETKAQRKEAIEGRSVTGSSFKLKDESGQPISRELTNIEKQEFIDSGTISVRPKFKDMVSFKKIYSPKKSGRDDNLDYMGTGGKTTTGEWRQDWGEDDPNLWIEYKPLKRNDSHVNAYLNSKKKSNKFALGSLYGSVKEALSDIIHARIEYERLPMEEKAMKKIDEMFVEDEAIGAWWTSNKWTKPYFDTSEIKDREQREVDYDKRRKELRNSHQYLADNVPLTEDLVQDMVQEGKNLEIDFLKNEMKHTNEGSIEHDRLKLQIHELKTGETVDIGNYRGANWKDIWNPNNDKFKDLPLAVKIAITPPAFVDDMINFVKNEASPYYREDMRNVPKAVVEDVQTLMRNTISFLGKPSTWTIVGILPSMLYNLKREGKSGITDMVIDFVRNPLRVSTEMYAMNLGFEKIVKPTVTKTPLNVAKATEKLINLNKKIQDMKAWKKFGEMENFNNGGNFKTTKGDILKRGEHTINKDGSIINKEGKVKAKLGDFSIVNKWGEVVIDTRTIIDKVKGVFTPKTTATTLKLLQKEYARQTGHIVEAGYVREAIAYQNAIEPILKTRIKPSVNQGKAVPIEKFKGEFNINLIGKDKLTGDFVELYYNSKSLDSSINVRRKGISSKEPIELTLNEQNAFSKRLENGEVIRVTIPTEEFIRLTNEGKLKSKGLDSYDVSVDTYIPKDWINNWNRGSIRWDKIDSLNPLSPEQIKQGVVDFLAERPEIIISGSTAGELAGVSLWRRAQDIDAYMDGTVSTRNRVVAEMAKKWDELGIKYEMKRINAKYPDMGLFVNGHEVFGIHDTSMLKGNVERTGVKLNDMKFTTPDGVTTVQPYAVLYNKATDAFRSNQHMVTIGKSDHPMYRFPKDASYAVYVTKKMLLDKLVEADRLPPIERQIEQFNVGKALENILPYSEKAFESSAKGKGQATRTLNYYEGKQPSFMDGLKYTDFGSVGRITFGKAGSYYATNSQGYVKSFNTKELAKKFLLDSYYHVDLQTDYYKPYYYQNPDKKETLMAIGYEPDKPKDLIIPWVYYPDKPEEDYTMYYPQLTPDETYYIPEPVKPKEPLIPYEPRYPRTPYPPYQPPIQPPRQRYPIIPPTVTTVTETKSRPRRSKKKEKEDKDNKFIIKRRKFLHKKWQDPYYRITGKKSRSDILNKVMREKYGTGFV